jgi:triphosphatase
MDGHEVELKLALEPDGLERVKRTAILRETRQGRPSARLLSSTYYDTADFTLAKAGIAVRLRSSGRAARIQTVKTAGSRVSGLFARREWETIVAGGRLDVTGLRATGLDLLQDDSILAALAPVFSTDIRRIVYNLAGDGWRVELALDHGSVGSATARLPICEAELELKEGAPAHLYMLAQKLTEAVPARLLAVSKSERGYEMASGTPVLPVKARPVPLRRDMPVGEAFQAIARNCLDQVLANERCLLATHDPEAIHQMRVALRRLRSALKVFAALVAGPQLAEAKAEIRWLLGHLGPARDADVFLAEIIDPVLAANPDHPGLASLHAAWRARRDTEFAQAVDAVAGRRFTALMLALGAWVEAGDWHHCAGALPAQPVGVFARKVLAKHDRKLMKAGGKRLDRLPPEALHAVRILGKQMRYAGEFFVSLKAKHNSKAFLGALAELQDVLGKINDIAVAIPRLAASAHRDDHAWAAGLVAGWHDHRRPALVAKADHAWRRLRKLKR